MSPSPQHPYATIRGRHTDAGFTVIEVIVAALILAIVLGGAAVTIGSGAKAQEKVANQTEQVKVGQKALEQLAGDQSARTKCNATWKTQVPPYAACTTVYTMVGATGRRYTATTTVVPIDDASDGLYSAAAAKTVGMSTAGDADMDTRDHYDATVRVKLQLGYDVGLTDNSSTAPVPPTDIAGRVDWHELASNGSVHVDVCAFDRPDRSIQNVTCAPGGATHVTPAGGVTVRLVPTNDPGNGSASPVSGVSSGAGGIDFTRTVLPGTYTVIVSGTGSNRFFKTQPSQLRVRGGDLQTIAVTLSRPGGATFVCGYVSNPDETWGYEINSTHVMWGIAHSPAYRGASFDTYVDNSNYSCTASAPQKDSDGHVLIPAKQRTQLGDPLRYDDHVLFRGNYSLELQEVAPPTAAVTALRIQRVGLSSTPCSTSSPGAGTLPDGSSVLSSASVAPDSGELPVWKGYYNRASDATQYICVQMYIKPVPKLRCTAAPYSGCRYDGTICDLYCPAGANVCVSNCTTGPPTPPPGAVGPPAVVDNTGVTGGPNDPTVPCATANPPAAWSSSWWKSPGSTSDYAYGTWHPHDWIGASNSYPYSYAGGHAWGAAGKFTCDEYEFAAKNANLSSGQYHFGECIEVEGFGHKVRGLVEDTTSGAGRLWLSINAARALRPNVNDGPLNLIDNWNAYGFARQDHGGNPGLGYDSSGWPNLKVRKVTGDATCHWSDSDAPVFAWHDPVINPLYTTPDVAQNVPDPPNDAKNVGNVEVSPTNPSSTAPPVPGLRSL